LCHKQLLLDNVERFGPVKDPEVMAVKFLAVLLVGSVFLSACASTSTRYDPSDVGKTVETSTGSVVSSRVVEVSGDNSNAGTVGGGALGAATGGIVGKSGWAAVIGGVVGAGAGYLAETQLRAGEGIEYIVQMDDGRTVTLVQNRESGEPPIANGTAVLVQLGGKYSRVIPDPRGPSSRSAGGWVDPDAVPPPGANPPPTGTTPSDQQPFFQ
jgi:outer membrane lipoprotein SlyB